MGLSAHADRLWDEWLTADDVAKAIGRSNHLVYHYIRHDHEPTALPAVKVGRKYLIHRADFAVWRSGVFDRMCRAPRVPKMHLSGSDAQENRQ